MYGDSGYDLVAAGSTAASAATAHRLLGLYNGLSLISSNDALTVHILPVGNSAEILPNSTLAPGIFVSTSQSLYQPLLPMSPARVESLHFRNAVGASNSTIRWVIWRKVP